MADESRERVKRPASVGFGGVPYDLEIRKMFDRFGVPVDGDVILYVDICLVLGEHITFRHPRFKGLTWTWRKKLKKDHNILMTTIPGEAFRVLVADERVDEAMGRFKKGGREIRTSMIHNAHIDRAKIVDPAQRALSEKLAEVSARLFRQVADESKTFPPPPPVLALPRRTVQQ